MTIVRRTPRRDVQGDGRWLLVVAFTFALIGILGVGAIMLGRAQGLGL